MEIFFTKRASKNYKSIKEYISGNFGILVADVFENKLIDFLELLKVLS
ncbi:hypothetical protein Aeqsu_2456 [Aequorivita sublithincola DSM 14238]|uniref:Plasmid stabilization system protein n=1 Tax=Aequorivita sublithincola (strain DSM 14238 / LMG 21431 / ACAM 643 / 9-3) TaxID=746697 RepID=I3YY46_AEQSU|nr:type II toxin-antitoxin system RelE/ParE family toxin [Aequorivita sublithincola]AFL81914.1 hypothetical protein Aeqsu_2456 [Aequorivita sublithincola DSM 14238]